MTTRQLAKIAKRVGFWALIALIMVYAVFPFYYAVITSLKPSSDLFRWTTTRKSLANRALCERFSTPSSSPLA